MTPPLYHDYIKQVLPHRPPFLLVDRVDHLFVKDKDSREGRTIEAAKSVNIDDFFFQGHFPNKPIMPGVIILEAICQAGLLAAFTPKDKYDCLLRSLSQSKFRSPVTPGMELKLQAEVIKDRSNTLSIEGTATVQEKRVAETKIIVHYFLHSST